jgi:proteasome inhibitor subunit 1 (PI31)
MDVVITDYFSGSSFPVATSGNLESAFASPARLKDLISLYKTNVISSIAPGLTKAGSSSSEEDRPTIEREQQQDRRARGYYPDPGGPALPAPNQPRFGPPQNAPFADIGRSDLLPLGGMGGTTGTGRLFGDADGTGMMMGPNHPLFRDRFQNNGPRANVPQGPWGGDGCERDI